MRLAWSSEWRYHFPLPALEGTAMRLVIALLAVLFGSLPVAGTANAAAEGKRVMLLGTANTNPYIGAWTSTFSRFATQAGMKVTNLSSNYDAAVQSQQVDDAIAQKFDMIVIVYVNDQAIIPALTRAKAANIPVVLVVTPLKKDYDNLVTSYIGTDHAELGRLAAEGMVNGLKAEGKTKAQIVAVTGIAQQLNVQTRVAAFKDVLAKNSSWSPARTASGTQR
jgi:ABC-type sugar transport system substrate-binding protein